MSDLSVQAVGECVGAVHDPELARPLSALRMIKDVAVEGDRVIVSVELPTPAYPNSERLVAAIQSAVKGKFPGVAGVDVHRTSTTRGKDTGGRIGLRVHNVIAVGSGKGGVGKSTVAASLAVGLKSFGARVGLMDADVYGPSIPHMLNAKGKPAAEEIQNEQGQKMMRMDPIDVDGLKMMSMGFFIEQGQSVVWRGPMLHKALTQFLKDTNWGELDYLVIDLPPGTGDVSLTLSQLVGLAGAVIVCTPQQVALLDAIKAIHMYGQVNVPILGVVENMTGEVFGRGGARRVAEELSLPFLGEIPIDASIRELSDAGRLSELLDEGSSVREPLRHVCERLAIEVAREVVLKSKGPTLEIL